MRIVVGERRRAGRSRAAMARDTTDGGPEQPLGACEREIEALLKRRATHRTVIVVALIFLLLAFLVVSSSSGRRGEVRTRPRAIVLVVPHLRPEAVEAAMASNKAPFLGSLSATDGIYARLRARNTGLTASLVTMLTGSVNSSATNLVGATSFLGELKRAGKRPIVLAPSVYWSAQGPTSGNCSRVGLLDSECAGTACPPTTEAAYCNAAEKLLPCDGKAQLYTEDVLGAFRHLMRHDGDLLYAHADVTSGAAATREEHLALLSDVSVMDGTLGKLALAAIERTRATSESWLLVLVGAGGDHLQEVPLAMAAYAAGNLVRLGPIPDDATLADVGPTVLHWYALSSPSDSQRVRGLCSTGVIVSSCKKTTNWP